MSKRPYHSDLRQAQAAQTQDKLLEALEVLLSEVAVEEVSLPKVAARAGVTAPTAYRYFPTLDDLYGAFFEKMRPELGLDPASLSALGPDDTPARLARQYRGFERRGQLLRRLLDSPTWTRLRMKHKVDRAALLEPAFRPIAPELSRADLRVALGAIVIFASPSSWRWLRDIWGLSPRDAGRAVAFATRAMIRELARGGLMEFDDQPRKNSA